MSEPQLVTNETRRGFRITWYFPEEDTLGANLGEEKTSDVKDPHERAELKAMQKAALKTNDVQRDESGFFWPSERLANAAKRVVLAVQKADRPWPAWAIKAQSEGWKPPRGWSPRP